MAEKRRELYYLASGFRRLGHGTEIGAHMFNPFGLISNYAVICAAITYSHTQQPLPHASAKFDKAGAGFQSLGLKEQ